MLECGTLARADVHTCMCVEKRQVVLPKSPPYYCCCCSYIQLFCGRDTHVTSWRAICGNWYSFSTSWVPGLELSKWAGLSSRDPPVSVIPELAFYKPAPLHPLMEMLGIKLGSYSALSNALHTTTTPKSETSF